MLCSPEDEKWAAAVGVRTALKWSPFLFRHESPNRCKMSSRSSQVRALDILLCKNTAQFASRHTHA
jgi:hypothetical protein